METGKSKLLTPLLAWFLVAMILANIAGQMLYTLLAVYLADLGASVTQVGLVFTLASIVPMVLQIFGGWLSDSIGRLKTIAIGATVASFSYIIFPLAPTWQWVLAGLCLEYVSNSLVGPSFGAFIADQSSEENRGKVFGISQGIFMVVGVIGPALGGFLADLYGFRIMLAIAGGVYVSAAVLRVGMALWVKEKSAAGSEPPSLVSLRSNLGVMLTMLVSGGVLSWIFITDGVRDIASNLSNVLEPLYISQVGGLSVTQIGLLHSAFSAAMMLVMLPAGWLSDRFGERTPIVTGFGLQVAAMVIFLIAQEFWVFVAYAALFGVGVGIMAPAYNALISKVVPEKNRGVAFGLFYTSLGLISLPAPWIGARLWESLGPRIPFLLTAVAMLVSIFPAWFKFRLPAKTEVVEQGQDRSSGLW
jgi:MFS family permease